MLYQVVIVFTFNRDHIEMFNLNFGFTCFHALFFTILFMILFFIYDFFLRFWIYDCVKATIWVFNTYQVCHVWCNFYPGYACRTTVIFGTLKDSLEINSLALNNCFNYYRNVFQNGVNALSKMVLKKLFFFFFFVKELEISFILDHTILFKFH